MSQSKQLTPAIKQDCLNAISKAKMQLMFIKNTGFTVSVLMALKTEIAYTVKTAAVNGTVVKYNPDFVLGLSEPERVGLLAHEAWHYVLDHLPRALELNDVDLKLYNKAADHVINLMLLDKGYVLPKSRLADNRFTGMTTEQVYAILKDEQDDSDNPYEDLENSLDGDTPPEQVNSDISDIVIQAAMANANAGNGAAENLPNWLVERIKNKAKPKVSWRDLYKRFTLTRKRDDYSYKRPNRRIPDFYLPSLYNESCKDFVVAADISYSISAEELTAFFYETEYARKQLKPEVTRVIQWHHGIASEHELQARQPLSIIPFAETGGTDIYPLFERLLEKPPKSCVIFTDGEFHMWDKPELIKFPVIWLIYNKYRTDDWFKPSFGQVVYYDPELEQ